MQSEFKSAGELYWCQFPLSDKIDKSKKRPVVIISAQESNKLDDDYIVLPITRTVRSDSFSVLIQPTDILEGLKIEDEIRCNKPFTVRNTLLLEKIGKLENAVTEQAIRLTKQAIHFE
jgi:mRNA interferase MazF